ncbi:MAG: CopG family transcriptional regulator, partial [Deltaproteobacteria bacterium]|nr:CopG family transcriptional regulator [Deltaproteobacteria bacterium]
MKSKIKYTEEPMGKLMVVKDFLPAPDQLVLKEE